MRKIAFYISSHGYGHAVRMKEIIAFLIRSGNVDVLVKSSPPASLFLRSGLSESNFFQVNLDPGIVEKNIFEIDWDLTAETLLEFWKSEADLVQQEVRWVKANEIDLIVADISFLAGKIGHLVGVPVIGISNFLWDWVYEPMAADSELGLESLERIREGYKQFTLMLRLPFGHPMKGNVRDVPLVAPIACLSEAEIFKSLAIKKETGQKVVVVSLRAGSLLEVLFQVAKSNPDLLILEVGEVSRKICDNYFEIQVGKVGFADAISVADVVIGKPGYGLMAASVAHGKRMLVVKREGFREDELLISGVKKYGPVKLITPEEFAGGKWGQEVHNLLYIQQEFERPGLDGAAECAEILKGCVSADSGRRRQRGFT